jgi:hypothetical protein
MLATAVVGKDDDVSFAKGEGDLTAGEGREFSKTICSWERLLLDGLWAVMVALLLRFREGVPGVVDDDGWSTGLMQITCRLKIFMARADVEVY